MTMKEIVKMASNEEIMETLKEIADIQSNMCFKTIYEKRSAIKKVKQLAKMIQELSEEC